METKNPELRISGKFNDNVSTLSKEDILSITSEIQERSAITESIMNIVQNTKPILTSGISIYR